MADAVEEDDGWPPPKARVQSALWRAEGHIERREYGQAARALVDVAALAPPGDRELVRGLHHLAAAGRRARDGEHDRARRQLEHARRRLAPYLPVHREVDVAALIALVEAEIAA